MFLLCLASNFAMPAIMTIKAVSVALKNLLWYQKAECHADFTSLAKLKKKKSP